MASGGQSNSLKDAYYVMLVINIVGIAARFAEESGSRLDALAESTPLLPRRGYDLW